MASVVATVRRVLRTPVSVLTLAGLLVEATVVGAVAYGLLGLAGMALVTAANVVVVAVAVLVLTSLAQRPSPGGPNGTDHTTFSGSVARNQRQLLESITDFADTVAREIMSPRPDMVTVDASFQTADVVEVSLLNGYSRLPVCGEGIDDIVGLVYSKDLMRAESDGKTQRPVSELLRPAWFVPETKRLPELLREMQHQQLHMAIVIDEYGGTAGLVTLEDIIEQLVGDIVDEFDVEDASIEPLPSGDLLVRGRTPIDELSHRLGTALPEGDWDTVGGLVSGLLGHLPVPGEAVTVADWRLTAERIQGRRISRVRISRVRPPSANDQGAGYRSAKGNDAGFVGGAEALPFGLLIFVVGTLLVANAWAVVDAKFAVDAATREATRHYVEANVVDSSAGATAEAAAIEAGGEALEAHGRDRSRADIRLTGLARPGGTQDASTGAFVRCARVTFTASYPVPMLTVPWVGGYGAGLDVTSQHSEVIDPYRDGVPGTAEGC